MSEHNNGKTQKISRGCEGRLTSSQSEGLGNIQGEGPIDGIESLGDGVIDSSGQNTSGAIVYIHDRETTAGKILKRLELLEKAFKSYVGGHRQRLEARLDENKEFVETFEEEMEILKQEVYNLVLEESKSSQQPTEKTQ